MADKTVNAGESLASCECGQHKSDNHKNQRVSLASIVAWVGQITFQKFHKTGDLILIAGYIANHRFAYSQKPRS
jgi:hypothetical protein